jgi:uncharacterized protein (DUF1330 family)
MGGDVYLSGYLIIVTLKRQLRTSLGRCPARTIRTFQQVRLRAMLPLSAVCHEWSCHMAKGYWIAHVTVNDPEGYKEYVAANAIAFKKFGAKFIVRGGEHKVAVGTAMNGKRHVVLEFDSYAVAKACYDSPEYAAASKIRDKYSVADLVIIEGYVG